MSSNNNNTQKNNSDDTETNWDVSEYEMIRQYLLQHPTLSRHHIGIVAAINGVQQEWEKYCNRRRQEEEQQQQKKKEGQQQPSIVTTSSTPTDHDWEDITKDKDHHDEMNCDDDNRDTTATSIMQQQQSTMIISTLAQHQISCSYPISAIAIVLHTVIMIASLPGKAAATSESASTTTTTTPASLSAAVVKFICTGIPETTNHTGFAPPIRDLPIGQLVPPNWEEKNDLVTTATNLKKKKIQFRYRKIIERGTIITKGSYILSVEEVVADDDGVGTNLSITLSPLVATTSKAKANGESKEASTPPFVIGLFDYINEQSWETAMKNISSTTTTNTTNKKIPPFLHYKGLSQLIQLFVQHFHNVLLLEENDDKSFATATTTTNDPFATHYYNAGAIKNIPPPTATSSSNYNPMMMTTPTSLQPPPLSHPFMVQNPGTTTTTPNCLPSGGHFDSDLHPTFGQHSPYTSQQQQQQGPPGMIGSVMGPDHPIFTNGPWNNNDNNNNMDMGSPWNPTFGSGISSMKPRFDPFGPPGGPTEIDPFQQQQQQSSKKRPPGGNGIPNNDLAIPPPFGGNNMFL